MRKLFGTSVPGLDSTVTSLSQLGVAFQKDGTLKLDTGKLQTAIDKNSDDVIKLLATSGSTTDSLVSFVSSTSNSTVGTKGISISKLATQGTLVGSTAANLNIIAGVNDSLSLRINGVSTKATLVPGNYTADSLVSHLQSLINGASGVTDTTAGVKVTQENGVFSIVSNKYGSSSKLEITGNGADDLFGTPTMTTGVDVAGTIDGAVAVGSGQTLTGSAGSGSAGIAVLIKGGQLGDRGTVNISKGISALFATITDSYLGTSGLIQNKNDGLNKSIADIAKQRDALNTRLTLTEARLRKQYSSLDVTLSSMNSTSNYLTQQLAALAAELTHIYQRNTNVWIIKQGRAILRQGRPGNGHRCGFSAQADRHAVRRRAGGRAERADAHESRQYPGKGQVDFTRHAADRPWPARQPGQECGRRNRRKPRCPV